MVHAMTAFPLVKLYVHYEDAWWRNVLRLTNGTFNNSAAWAWDARCRAGTNLRRGGAEGRRPVQFRAESAGAAVEPRWESCGHRELCDHRGDHALFDVDDAENENLAGDPRFAEQERELHELLVASFRRGPLQV